MADEVIRNLRSLPLLSGGIAALVLCITLGAGLLSALDTSDLYKEWSQREDAGYSTFVVTGKYAALSATQCDGANTIDGVRAAGGVLSQNIRESSGAAGTGVLFVRATPRFAEAIWRDSSLPSAVVVGEDLARRLGLRIGSYVRVGDQVIRVSSAKSRKSEVPAMDGAVISSAIPVGNTAQCYVAARPENRDVTEVVIRDYFGQGRSVSRLFIGDGTSRDPDYTFSRRIGQWVVLAAGLIVMSLVCMSWFSRRQDFALYRVLGVTKAGVILMLSVEWIFLCLGPASIGQLVATSVLVNQPSQVLLAVLSDFLRFDALLVLIPLIGVASISRVAAATQLKGG